MDSCADDALRSRLATLAREGTRDAAHLDELESLILRAAETGDDRLEFDARTHWIGLSAVHHRPVELRIANLSWCFHWMDGHPGQSDRRGQVTCLRESARLIQQISLDPTVSIGEIRRLLHTYRQLRVRGGFSEHAEHALRVKVAWAVGDNAEAAYRWARLIESYPDDLSPCSGCSTADEVLLLSNAERWHRAAEVALDHLTAETSEGCLDHPFTLQAVSLRALTLTGSHDLARELADQAWDQIMERHDHPVSAGCVVQWQAWSGDPAGAAGRIEEYLPHLDGALGSIPGYRHNFMAGAAYTMRLLVDEGWCRTPILGSTPAELATRWGAECRDRTRRFDARNRTSTGTRTFERAFAMAPWRGQLVGPDPDMPPTELPRRRPEDERPLRARARSAAARTAAHRTDTSARRTQPPLTVDGAMRSVRWWTARER